MAWERKILRKIYGPPSGYGYWIMKINKKNYNTFISSDIVTVIKVSRSEWVGHVVGMDGGRTVMKLLKTILGETKDWKPRVR
jgi:hypothetical protein